MSIIEVKHLTKKYDQHLAVNDISFSVEEGNYLHCLVKMALVNLQRSIFYVRS